VARSTRSACADAKEEIPGRDNLQGPIPREHDDLQRKEVATVIGDQKMRAALDVGCDDWAILEVAWDLVEISVGARHELARLSQSTHDGVYFIVLKTPKGAHIGLAKSPADLAKDIVRDQGPEVTAHQSVEHTNRSRLAPPQYAANEDVRVNDRSNECPRHAGLASRLG